LIALDKIGLLNDLETLFDELVIPPAVAREIAPTVDTPTWIVQRSLTVPVDPLLLAASLGPGETEAIALAMELGMRAVLIDELAGRNVAKHLRVPVVGTLGLLLIAKEEGFIGVVAPILQVLLATGFFASSSPINEIFVRAGELPDQHS
jgi:predicted nucleic acid-binding protein